MADECEVCCGFGTYPIINKYGKELYSISCPECLGFGSCDDRPEPGLREKYDAAMAEKRAQMPLWTEE